MPKNEIAYLEFTYGVFPGATPPYLVKDTTVYHWLVVTNQFTKKVLSRYGPFESAFEAERHAKEHHIEIEVTTKTLVTA